MSSIQSDVIWCLCYITVSRIMPVQAKIWCRYKKSFQRLHCFRQKLFLFLRGVCMCIVNVCVSSSKCVSSQTSFLISTVGGWHNYVACMVSTSVYAQDVQTHTPTYTIFPTEVDLFPQQTQLYKRKEKKLNDVPPSLLLSHSLSLSLCRQKSCAVCYMCRMWLW